jgi:hypothetical protein
MPAPDPRQRTSVLAAAALAMVMVLAGCDGDDTLTQRQADVAERGAQVMPFDLEATTHVFTKNDAGGIQLVTADRPEDRTQVDLIRAHLRAERDNFARGDFDDPAAIHGHDMGGVAELEGGYADITVSYAELTDGARLTYETDDPELIEAIHSWFDRQVIDHGTHARAG